MSMSSLADLKPTSLPLQFPPESKSWNTSERLWWARNVKKNRGYTRQERAYVFDSPLRSARLNTRLRNATPEEAAA